jgi:hypothetical protein
LLTCEQIAHLRAKLLREFVAGTFFLKKEVFPEDVARSPVTSLVIL